MNSTKTMKSIVVCALAFVAFGIAPKPASASGGDLDKTFGNQGKVEIDFTQNVPRDYEAFYANAVAIQPDGKIVAAGTVALGSGRGSSFALMRYTKDGVADASFGPKGLRTTPIGVAASARAVAIQRDGKIVAAGTATVKLLSMGNEYTTVFAVARYNSNGEIDKSFGDQGTFARMTIFSGQHAANAVAIQSDGKIVAAGYAYEQGGRAFAMVRLDVNGVLDPSFGDGGKTTTPFPVGGDASANAVAIQPDGKIVAAGVTQLNPLTPPNPLPKYWAQTTATFALARYSVDGRLDSTFGNKGRINTPLLGTGGGSASANAVAIQADGKIVAAGQSRVASSDRNSFLLVRYDPAKSVFPNAPFVVNIKNDGFVNASAMATAITLHNDGRIVVAGYASWEAACDSCGGGFRRGTEFAVARYLPDLSSDPTFGISGTFAVPGPEGYVGTAGKVVTHTAKFASGSAFAFAVAIQADGKIVAAGGSGTDDSDHHVYAFMLARYQMQ